MTQFPVIPVTVKCTCVSFTLQVLIPYICRTHNWSSLSLQMSWMYCVISRHSVDYKVGQYFHCNDVIMGAIASQITSLTIVYSTVYSDVDQRKHQSSASLAFVRGIHRRPVNSPHKWPVTRNMFPFDDVVMHTCFVGYQLMEAGLHTYMRQWPRPSVVWIMVCRLFGGKPLPEWSLVLIYCQLNPSGTNFSEIWVKMLR